MTSNKDLAEVLTIDANAYGSGWGVEVKASFSYKKDYSLKTNEVALRAHH